ncbi:MAG TPA: right-handed parallel beta-helix repeat-containing protein [Steroidobacteraceae bacterium]|nr:right-handed parallel beta-helix repeat-containing protein [Steroidobacteraceae bacterium]
MKSKRILGLALPVLFLAAATAKAACIPIDTIPYVIAQSGFYCVTRDLTANFTDQVNAITISVSHVDLDFQGHTVSDTSTQAASVGVLFASFEAIATDVKVHGGTLDGFLDGIRMTTTSANTETSNFVVDNMTVRNSRLRGIVVYGSAVTVTNNHVYNTHHSAAATGIEIRSTMHPGFKASNRALIQNNEIRDTYVTQASQYASAVGLDVGYYIDMQIRGNLITNTWVPLQAPNASAIGMDIDQTDGVCAGPCASVPSGALLVEDNRVSADFATIKVANTNSTGVRVRYPSDHAIISGSTVIRYTTGIDVSSGAWPNTPAVLLLRNKILAAVTPTKGGLFLPE